MRTRFLLLFIAITVVLGACSQAKAAKQEEGAAKQAAPVGFVLVQGGTVVNATSNFHGNGLTVASFYIGKYEVTQSEWSAVMGTNPSQFKGARLPVEMVSWYDALEFCNKRSLREGLTPYYDIDKTRKDPSNTSEHDTVKWTVKVHAGANGYRLPTEEEWEYAAGGGRLSKSFAYSGSNNADEVAWNWTNAGDKRLMGDWNWPAIENNRNAAKAVGGKKPNELGLYDMSGNVREWCWDWYQDAEISSGAYRVVKGGGWIGDVSNNAIAFRGKFEANGFGPDQGFRLIRNA